MKNSMEKKRRRRKRERRRMRRGASQAHKKSFFSSPYFFQSSPSFSYCSELSYFEFLSLPRSFSEAREKWKKSEVKNKWR
jgi:hypothetical protein